MQISLKEQEVIPKDRLEVVRYKDVLVQMMCRRPHSDEVWKPYLKQAEKLIRIIDKESKGNVEQREGLVTALIYLLKGDV